MFRHTVADVAERLDVDKNVTRGLVKFLERIGLCEAMGERKPDNGRGRAETVFEFSEGFEEKLATFLKLGKLSD
jgi:predicted ArsR family transcriptional regulator